MLLAFLFLPISLANLSFSALSCTNLPNPCLLALLLPPQVVNTMGFGVRSIHLLP